MAYKIDPATGEFQVDPSTGEFIEDGSTSDPRAALASLMQKSQQADLSRSPTGSADASNVSMDQNGALARPNVAPGANLVQGALPRTSAIDAGGHGNGPLAYAMDLASLPGRALASAPQALDGGMDAVVKGMQDTKGDRLVGKVLRSPSTAAMAAAGPLGLIPAAIAGGMTSQADNVAQGGDFSVPGAVGESALNAAGGYVLGKAGKAAWEAAKPIASKAVTAALERPAIQSLLGKLGYNPELMGNSLPSVAGEGAEKNAPYIVAQKLKEYNLLHAPEKANLNLQNGLEKYGSAIDKVVKAGTEADVTVKPQEVLNNFARNRAQLLNQTGKGSTAYTDLVKNALPKIQAAINKLNPDETGAVSLEKAVNFRRDLQDMVKNWGDAPNKGMIQNVAKELQSDMNDAIESSHNIYGPQLAKLNSKYSDLMDMAPMIEGAYQNAFQKSATGTDGVNLPHTKYGMVGKLINSPRVSAMDLLPGLADKIANRGAGAGLAEDVIPKITPDTVTPEDVQALKASFLPSDPNGLPPRGPVYARPPLEEKPAAYVNGPAVPPSPFGPATPASAPQFDPMADMYPGARNPLEEPQSGIPGVEGMMHPQDIAAREALAQADREALIRQSRPDRIPSPNPSAGGVQILSPNDVGLRPRAPRGGVQPNGFPQLQESDPIKAVLNKFEAGRRPLVVNQEKINALAKLLKQDLPKAKKQEILKLIRAENMKIPMSGSLETW